MCRTNLRVIIFVAVGVFSQKYYGGAIDFDGLAGSLRRCWFSSNNACDDYSTQGYGYGGAVQMKNGEISDSTFESNIASSGGGALCVVGDVAVRNCTFDGNSATDGGAIYAIGSAVVEDGSVIRNCLASGNGAAIYSQSKMEISFSAVHSIVWGTNQAALYHDTPSGEILLVRAVDFEDVELLYIDSSTPGTIVVYNCDLNSTDVRLSSLLSCNDLAMDSYCAREYCSDISTGVTVRGV